MDNGRDVDVSGMLSGNSCADNGGDHRVSRRLKETADKTRRAEYQGTAQRRDTIAESRQLRQHDARPAGSFGRDRVNGNIIHTLHNN